ncbi:hypothetical protein MJG53_012998 [Ovis ammon polii x Ovis aries]|uniref:Uncharacterized protein n=1 Tax=Ovis ammon polii x Ovis aries TaxID=2918886 RepID=A0ACB9UN22_9CETA|nr:hypothetical protein MJG53_012998 [Ovis ammon polii x Ovis aries]
MGAAGLLRGSCFCTAGNTCFTLRLLEYVFHPGLALPTVLEGLSLQALPVERRPLKLMRWEGSGEGAERKLPIPASLAPQARFAFLRAQHSPREGLDLNPARGEGRVKVTGGLGRWLLKPSTVGGSGLSLRLGCSPLPSLQAWQSSAFTSLQRESGPWAGGVLIGLQNAQAPWDSGGFIKVLINGLIVPTEVWAPALGKTLCFPPPSLA